METAVKSVVEQFDELFVGRRDIYAAGYQAPNNPEKYRYHTIEEDLTLEVLKKHLKGEVCVGVYPIMLDSTVGWFAIDFDAPKDKDGTQVDNAFEAAWEAAGRQLIAFEKVGLHVYLERSRSGKGVHVWGFLQERLPAGVVRAALKPLLTDHEILKSRDRMYPVQDELSDQKPIGNLIALPFFGEAFRDGNSAFLDTDGQPINPRTFLASVRRNASAVIQHLAAKNVERKVVAVSTAKGTVEYRPKVPLTGALKVISTYGCKFMNHCWENRKTLPEPLWYAAIQQATCFDYGRDFAQALSRDYAKYDPAEVDAKFDQALQSPPIGCSWIKENYPELLCANCTNKAPYHVAKKSVGDLFAGSSADIEHVGPFAEDIERIKSYDSKAATPGILWGIPGLDQYVRLRPSEITFVGAMQSIGKTWLMVAGAVALASRGIPVQIFSAETGRESLRQRLLSHVAGVDLSALKGERQSPLSTSEWARIHRAAAELEAMPIYTDYTSLSADDILRQVESVLLRNHIPLDKPYVLFFDYLQFGLKQAGDDSEVTRLSRVSAELKYITKILGRPVVVFSQLQREREGEDTPKLTWFKGTGRIESDGDVCLIITGERVSGQFAPRLVWIVKQREGVANVCIPFTLDQTCGLWKHNDNTAVGNRPDLLSELRPRNEDE